MNQSLLDTLKKTRAWLVFSSSGEARELVAEIDSAITELEKMEPAGYIVQEEGEDGISYGYAAPYPEAVHEHINDRILLFVESGVKPPVMHCVEFCLRPSNKKMREDAARYRELLFAVGNKYPNESRHETALRYIKQAESASCDAARTAKGESSCAI